MRVDITSMFFNSKIEGKTATPAWSTSIGENDIRSYKLGVSQLIDSLTLNVCIDKEHLDLSGGSDSCDLLYFCVFDQVSVNGILLPDISYIIYLVREHSNSHEGRIRLCYPPYAKYTKKDGTIVWNENSNKEIAKSIGCTPNGCWFVYDISVVNQHTLNFDTKVVNNSEPVIYKGESKDRSAIWNGMLSENNDIPSEKKLGEILGQMYKTADTGFQVAAIYVFGVKYGKYLSGCSLKNIIQFADLSSSFESELSKAYKLYQSISKNKYNISSSRDIEKLLSENTELPLQRILYGAPGTGKSFSIKSEIAKHQGIGVEKVDMEADYIFRTTFHPDYDYAQFVGCYKPTKTKPVEYVFVKDEVEYKTELDKINSGAEGEKVCKRINLAYCNLEIAEKYVDKIDKEKEKSSYSDTRNGINLAKLHAKTGATQTPSITYEFVPQVFTNALVKAYENPTENVYLVIEEINRGNCAQIFGDIFQLLDRNSETGVSEYAINVDEDLRKYLEDQKIDGLINDGKIKLPSNFNIIATMNTSDQSLFPMDSAFKRRWEWEYVPIKYNTSFVFTVDNDHKYKWSDFQRVVNDEILRKTHSEDKQMGDYFIKKNVNLDEFINKVMFYLWNDVCKENYHTEDNFFRTKAENSEDEKEFSFVEMMQDKSSHIIDFMRKLGVENIAKKNDDNEATEEAASN